MAIKYMCLSENKYPQLIESHLIVANNQLKLEKATEYLVSDVHSTRGYFAYAEEISEMSATLNSELNRANVTSHLQSQENMLGYIDDEDSFERDQYPAFDSSFKLTNNSARRGILSEQKISPRDAKNEDHQRYVASENAYLKIYSPERSAYAFNPESERYSPVAMSSLPAAKKQIKIN